MLYQPENPSQEVIVFADDSPEDRRDAANLPQQQHEGLSPEQRAAQKRSDHTKYYSDLILDATKNQKPHQAVWFRERGKLLTKDGQFKQALFNHDMAILLAHKELTRLKSIENRKLGDLLQASNLERSLHTFYKARGDARSGIEGKRNSERRILDYSNAIRFNPSNPELYRCRGDAYFRENSFAPAVQDYARALHLKPHGFNRFNSTTYYKRGIAYEKLGETTRAKADFLKALKHNLANRRAQEKVIDFVWDNTYETKLIREQKTELIPLLIKSNQLDQYTIKTILYNMDQWSKMFGKSPHQSIEHSEKEINRKIKVLHQGLSESAVQISLNKLMIKLNIERIAGQITKTDTPTQAQKMETFYELLKTYLHANLNAPAGASKYRQFLYDTVGKFAPRCRKMGGDGSYNVVAMCAVFLGDFNYQCPKERWESAPKTVSDALTRADKTFLQKRMNHPASTSILPRNRSLARYRGKYQSFYDNKRESTFFRTIHHGATEDDPHYDRRPKPVVTHEGQQPVAPASPVPDQSASQVPTKHDPLQEHRSSLQERMKTQQRTSKYAGITAALSLLLPIVGLPITLIAGVIALDNYVKSTKIKKRMNLLADQPLSAESPIEESTPLLT